jgi:hypothetical protein
MTGFFGFGPIFGPITYHCYYSKLVQQISKLCFKASPDAARTQLLHGAQPRRRIHSKESTKYRKEVEKWIKDQFSSCIKWEYGNIKLNDKVKDM